MCTARSSFVFAVALLAQRAHAQVELHEIQSFAAPTSLQNDRFGSLVAIDGDYAVVSAEEEHAAYAFVRVGGIWQFQQELVPTVPRFRYAVSVAIDGGWIAVGDDLADDANGFQLTGAVQMFRRVGTTWIHDQVVSEAVIHDEFGRSVGLSGDWLVGGARNPALSGVSFFRYDGTDWVLAQTVPDFIGMRVAIHGGVAAAGFFDFGTPDPPGRVRVYEFNGSQWQIAAQLQASDAIQGDDFGNALAVYEDTILVGARPQFSQGVVYVFRRTAGGWTEVQRITSPVATITDRFGTALDLDGSFALIGDPLPFLVSGTTGRGIAHLFRDLGGAWQPVARCLAANGSEVDRLGSGVGLTSGAMVGGAPTGNGAAGVSGVARAFELVPGASYCFGDGSATPCPCGNSGAAGTGCANSTGGGATLACHGTASVALDDLTFFCEGLIQGEPALCFVGRDALNGGNGVAFGDGLRCAGGAVVRLDVQTPDAEGSARFGPELGAQQGWSAGDVRRFQVYYLDPSGPCGSGFNLTNGWELQFRP